MRRASTTAMTADSARELLFPVRCRPEQCRWADRRICCRAAFHQLVDSVLYQTRTGVAARIHESSFPPDRLVPKNSNIGFIHALSTPSR